MNLFGWLLLLFIGVPLAEFYSFLWLGSRIGLLASVAVILLTGFAGAALARQEGMLAWLKVRETLARGQDPSRELLNGLVILVAGICLLIPGFVTDVVGLLLLLPPVRSLVMAALHRHWRPKVSFGPGGFGVGSAPEEEFAEARPFEDAGDDSEVIDVDVTEHK